MKKDLVIATLGAFAIHAGIAYGDRLFPSSADAAPTKQESVPTIEIVAPPVEPDPVPDNEIADANASADNTVADLAPPSQADVPTATIDAPFVQQIAPPRPAGSDVSSGAITIPTGAGAITGIRNAGAALFDLANLDQAPVPLAQIPPEYPAELRRRGLSGDVVVRFVVDAKGNVRDAVITRSSAHEFEEPALRAVSRWRFKPGRKGGAAVNTRMEIPLEFSAR